MSLYNQFLEISSFLKRYEDLWKTEVLYSYPESMDLYPKSWIRELKELSEDDLYKIDTHGDFSVLKQGCLKDWYKELKSLTNIEKHTYSNLKNLPAWAFHKVKFKKQHEILRIGEWLENKKKDQEYSHIVDIGGGVGHMARTLAHYYNTKAISLDCNKDFQAIGIKRLTKYPLPEKAQDIKFVNRYFGLDDESAELKEVFSKNALSIGLHTCGPLSLSHFKENIKNETKALLNFGCCYIKLDPNKDINISNFAKKNAVSFNKYTLTLATRGHNCMSLEDFRLKRRVKRYRYALQLLLLKHIDNASELSVGEAHQRDYWGDFSDYALKKINQLNLKISATKEELEKFYKNKELQEKLDDMFFANVIRWQLGRITEFYILLDRVFYLEEQGLEVEFKAHFDEEVSPRNIGIFARRK